MWYFGGVNLLLIGYSFNPLSYSNRSERYIFMTEKSLTEQHIVQHIKYIYGRQNRYIGVKS